MSYEVGIPYTTEIEYERKYGVDPAKLPPLRLPWILVQAYPTSPSGMEESIRYIPARNRAYQRIKSISFDGARQKASREMGVEQALQTIKDSAKVAYKERYLHNDESGRIWLIDHFPETDRWQAETEYDTQEEFDIDQWLTPDWATEDITDQAGAYTRTHATARTAQEVDKLVYEAGKGSAAPYTPSETMDTPDFLAQLQDQLNQVREAQSELDQKQYAPTRGLDYTRPDPIEQIRCREARDALDKEENRLMEELRDYMWLIPPEFEPPHNSSQISAEKAKMILRDGTVRGHALSAAQKRFFGAVAGGQKPRSK